jgi:hypothetical protein
MSTRPHWRSEDGKVRIIRDETEEAWLVQVYHNEDWRTLSQHEDWFSLKLRWCGTDETNPSQGPFQTLPDVPLTFSLLKDEDAELVRSVFDTEADD